MPKKPKPNNFHDELNFARFGVISMHSRIDREVTSWKSEFTINGRTFRIEAITPEGRPHGIDTDTLVAVETLFVASSCPEDNWVHTTAYEMRELMGLGNNGDSYHRLRQSLRRLYLTSVIVGRKTSVANASGRVTWDNVGVRFLEGIRYRDAEDANALSMLDGEATLSIRLGEQLAASIRNGVSQVLDGQLLHQLEQPPARALYRTLQAHRRQDDGTLLDQLRVPLAEWRLATGLTTERTDLVRRALEAAHDELLANRYLEAVSIEGHGKKAYASYTFAERGAADPALVVLLRHAGVTVSRATALAAQHPERVEEALRFLESRRASTGGTVRNPGGLVADFIENPGKYQLPEEFVEPRREREQRLSELTAKRQKVVEAEQSELLAQLAALESRSPTEQWEAHKGTLHLYLRKRFSPDQWERLEERCRSGEIQAAALARVLAAAVSSATLDDQVDQLRRSLNPLLPL